MFDFRIIVCADGTEIIDRWVKTFYRQLTQVQMVEYIEMEVQLEILDDMKRKTEPDYCRLPEI